MTIKTAGRFREKKRCKNTEMKVPKEDIETKFPSSPAALDRTNTPRARNKTERKIGLLEAQQGKRERKERKGKERQERSNKAPHSGQC